MDRGYRCFGYDVERLISVEDWRGGGAGECQAECLTYLTRDK